jgi:hypothetical protein
VVFCFGKPEDAAAFANRAIGDGQSAVTLKQAGDPSALFRTNAGCRT